jgi:hypothetical protein
MLSRTALAAAPSTGAGDISSAVFQDQLHELVDVVSTTLVFTLYCLGVVP